MDIKKKWNLLFIKDNLSEFNSDTYVFNDVFNTVDIVEGREESLLMFDSKQYDIVLSDLSKNPKEVAFLKQLLDKKPRQTIFALTAPKDSDKLFAIADLGIHAFELTPSQFDQALETIAQLDPYNLGS